MKLLGLASMVINSLVSLSTFDVAIPEDILSRILTWDEIQPLHLTVPATSGASQDKQQIENPICSIARLGKDMMAGGRDEVMNPTNNCVVSSRNIIS